VLDPDAGVAELGDPHGPTLKSDQFRATRGSHQMKAVRAAVLVP
jgi:hypothetical protein